MNKVYISLLCITASLSLSACSSENKPVLQAPSEQVSASVSQISYTQSIKNKLVAFAKKPAVRYAAAGSACLSFGSYMLWKNMYSVDAEQNSVVAKEVMVDVTDKNASTDNSPLFSIDTNTENVNNVNEQSILTLEHNVKSAAIIGAMTLGGSIISYAICKYCS